MKILTAVCLAITMSQACGAAEIERSYFVGEVKLSSDSGKSLGSQAILASKVYDPAKNLMVARAIIVQSDGTVKDYPMTMLIKGDTFTVDDPKKAVTGTGTLFGPPGHWTYYKATYKASNGAVIDDESLMAAPDVGCGRKKITTADGTVVMYMDTSLKAISREAFEILAAALVKTASAENR